MILIAIFLIKCSFYVHVNLQLCLAARPAHLYIGQIAVRPAFPTVAGAHAFYCAILHRCCLDCDKFCSNESTGSRIVADSVFRSKRESLLDVEFVIRSDNRGRNVDIRPSACNFVLRISAV